MELRLALIAIRRSGLGLINDLQGLGDEENETPKPWPLRSAGSLLYSDSWNNDLSQDWKRYGLPQTMGDPVRDADALKAVSPLQLADKLTRPLLLAMGGRDRRVAVEHGDKLNQALRAAGRARSTWSIPARAMAG